MSSYNLTNEQKALLRQITECDESNGLREMGLLILLPGNDRFQGGGCGIELDSLSDLEALCDEGLLARVSE